MDIVAKLPREAISNPTNPDFIQVSMCSKPSSSFHLAFGIGLLESLIRLHGKPEITDQTWNRLNSLQNYQLSAYGFQEKELISYNGLINIMQAQQNSSQQRLDWLRMMMQVNHQNSATILERAMKVFVCLVMKVNQNPDQIMNGRTLNPDSEFSTIAKLAQFLRIHVGVITNGRLFSIARSSVAGKAPLVCLLKNFTGEFSILYHKDHILQQESPETVDTSGYPFTHESDKQQLCDEEPIQEIIQPSPFERPSQSQQQSEPTEKLMSLLHLLAGEIINPSRDKGLIIARVKGACQQFSDLNRGDFWELLGFLSKPKTDPSPVQFRPNQFRLENQGVKLPENIKNESATRINSDAQQEIGLFERNSHPQFIPAEPFERQYVPSIPRNYTQPRIRPVIQSGGQNRIFNPGYDPSPQYRYRNSSPSGNPDNSKMRCFVCHQSKDSECFQMIKCPDHEVCSKCRALSFNRRSNQCPTCQRAYGNEELQLLHIIVESNPVQQRKILHIRVIKQILLNI